jgi:hypothetical protein
VQAFPDAARAFGDVGLQAASAMHFEVLVGAVAKELRAARPEVGEPGDVLLGRQCGCSVKVDCGHIHYLNFYNNYNDADAKMHHQMDEFLTTTEVLQL